MATAKKKAVGEKAAAKKKKSAAATKKKTAVTRDPAGGLTAAGRAEFARKEGAKLRPGVTGAADTPDKMRRKGSFLRRFFLHPRGPLVDEKGEPTRLALSAHAWGEKVPKTAEEARALAEKGAKLLARYDRERAPKGGKGSGAKRKKS